MLLTYILTYLSQVIYFICHCNGHHSTDRKLQIFVSKDYMGAYVRLYLTV